MAAYPEETPRHFGLRVRTGLGLAVTGTLIGCWYGTGLGTPARLKGWTWLVEKVKATPRERERIRVG